MPTTLYQVLALLGTGPAEALDLLRRLDEITGDDAPSVPSFYRYLRRGIQDGWIEVKGAAGADGARGRPRQAYGLTSEGERVLHERALEFQKFTRLALEGTRGSG